MVLQSAGCSIVTAEPLPTAELVANGHIASQYQTFILTVSFLVCRMRNPNQLTPLEVQDQPPAQRSKSAPLSPGRKWQMFA